MTFPPVRMQPMNPSVPGYMPRTSTSCCSSTWMSGSFQVTLQLQPAIQAVRSWHVENIWLLLHVSGTKAIEVATNIRPSQQHLS